MLHLLRGTLLPPHALHCTFVSTNIITEKHRPQISVRAVPPSLLFSSAAPSHVNLLRNNVPGHHGWDSLSKDYQLLYTCELRGLRLGLDRYMLHRQANSSELSEAINSMFAWYRNSDVCYAYLDDVRTNEHDRFRNSEWFMRGWTLQELLAPTEVVFFDEDWNYIGTRGGLADKISEVTRIPRDVLLDSSKITKCSVAQRMSWAADRRTTMEEDRAYSLMGLFGIYMPAIYGERKYAFIRLQEEIMRHYNDQSIFSWNTKSGRATAHGPLAPSPSNSDRRLQPEKIHVEHSPPPSSILFDFTSRNRLVFHIPHQVISNLDVKGLAPERLWTKGQNGGMNLTITGLRDVCCGTAIFQDRRTKAAFAIILGANRVGEDDSRVAWVDIASVAYDDTVAVSHTVSKAFGTYNIEAMIKLNPIQESLWYTVSIRRRMISPRHSIEQRNVVSSFRDRKYQQALRC
ncbi:hypothetical protein A0H81_06089 [Grifola frondosa]|uniref:DUF8212 domain-containing protein n=1 Tax=Grifola frondosa TaxID=5627 RepID=A0A1C7M9T0_GRIFR|nr:hypothetical protein A0H81_06089 [Grifola frondosa]